MNNDFNIINIREYFNHNEDEEIGENMLRQILSDYSCPINMDVERFLKKQSIEFTKKNQSVTYLVISNDDAEFLGYFTLAIKPIVVGGDGFSNTQKRKISRVSQFDETNGTYSLSAYLIAQIGKNYADDANKKITGK